MSPGRLRATAKLDQFKQYRSCSRFLIATKRQITDAAPIALCVIDRARYLSQLGPPQERICLLPESLTPRVPDSPTARLCQDLIMRSVDGCLGRETVADRFDVPGIVHQTTRWIVNRTVGRSTSAR